MHKNEDRINIRVARQTLQLFRLIYAKEAMDVEGRLSYGDLLGKIINFYDEKKYANKK